MKATLTRCGMVVATLLVCAIAPAGDVEAGRQKAKVCIGCHGPDGISVNPEWPNLAGQHERYLIKSIKAYRDGGRDDPAMSPMVTNLSDDDIEDLAAFYAAQRPK